MRRLRENPVPERTSGIVTIPFVDLSRSSGRTPPPANSYKVKRGDTVSKLLAGQFGRYGSKSYKEAVALFKQLNPHVQDIDLIFTNQTIFLPRGLQPPGSAASAAAATPSKSPYPQAAADPAKKTSGSGPRRPAKPMIPPLAEAAAILDAKLLDNGKYYFPRSEQEDLELNLARNPVLEMSDGSRVMLSGKQPLSPQEMDTVRSKWKTFTQVNIPESAPVEDILNTVLAAVHKSDQTPSLSFSAGGAEITIRARWIVKGTGTEMNPVRNICISFIEHPDERTRPGLSASLSTTASGLRRSFAAQNLRRLPALCAPYGCPGKTR